MAHKKAGGTSFNGRDSVAKRRGVKRFGGQTVASGEVIVRQKGYWYRPGKNTHVGTDWTIHASTAGVVAFSRKKVTSFSGSKSWATVVHIQPAGTVAAAKPTKNTKAQNKKK
jgi:large subunit ribosomal protein L27